VPGHEGLKMSLRRFNVILPCNPPTPAVLYFSAIVLSFFLAFLILTKRNKSYPDYLLFGWLCAIGTHLYSRYLFVEGNGTTYPSLIVLGFSLPLAHGPFLYLYTRVQLTGSTFRPLDLLHFLPAAASVLVFSDFHALPYDAKVDVFRQLGKGYETRLLINTIVLSASGVIYILASFKKLVTYRRNIVHQFSNTEKIRLDWLLYLMIWMVVIWSAVLFTRNDSLIFGAASLFVLWLGYFGIRQVKIFSQPHAGGRELPGTTTEKENHPAAQKENNGSLPGRAEEAVLPADVSKYQRSGLGEAEAELIGERLKALLAEQKPFKNPDLKLDELAKALDVHPNHLSQVINSIEKKNFYDLINELRVKEFIDQVSQPGNRQFTILAIAYECGFNSKTSFNRNFKKYTGHTPSDFVKSRVAAPADSVA
jgi:AraC-like DNA-binding protein